MGSNTKALISRPPAVPDEFQFTSLYLGHCPMPQSQGRLRHGAVWPQSRGGCCCPLPAPSGSGKEGEQRPERKVLQDQSSCWNATCTCKYCIENSGRCEASGRKLISTEVLIRMCLSHPQQLCWRGWASTGAERGCEGDQDSGPRRGHAHLPQDV